MADTPIRIRIGASVESTVERSFSSIEKRAQKAQVAVQRGQRQTASSAEKEAQREVKAKEKAAKEIERAASRMAKAQEREQQRLVRASESLDRQRSRALIANYKAEERAAAQKEAKIRRGLEQTARAAERAIARERRQSERSSRRAGESFARRTSHRASRFLTPEAPLASMAARGLRDVTSGLGVDLSIGGAFARNTALETQATQLSNSGYQAGQAGPNGQRVDPRELIAQARQTAGALGVSPEQALDALAQFQKLSGDLNQGRQQLAAMGQLAAATGSDLGEMAAAYANVANGLGDVENKAAMTEAVMRTIAGQGKLGAVEISDMATQMARVAASAGAFSGNKATNIQKMGALVQIARASGGAPSAAEAARSVVGFSSTFKKSARLDAFQSATGGSAFADETHTSLKDPIQLIKESLLATKGDLQKMNAIFMDVVGARAVSGLTNEFNSAGGGQAGIAKVDAMVDRMMDAQLKQTEIDESAKRASETAAAKAARFQNQLDMIAERTATKLIPALEKAGPSLLKFADVLGKVSTWALENPKSAIAVAITASIARAGIESTLRSGIERLITGGGGERAGKIGKAAGMLGAAGTIAALSVATVQVGEMIIDHFLDESDKKHGDTVAREAGAAGLKGAVEQKMAAGDFEGAKKLAQELVASSEQSKAAREDRKTGGFESFFQDFLVGTGIGDRKLFDANERRNNEAIAEQTRNLVDSKALLREISGHLADIAAKEPPPAGGGGPAGRVEQ